MFTSGAQASGRPARQNLGQTSHGGVMHSGALPPNLIPRGQDSTEHNPFMGFDQSFGSQFTNHLATFKTACTMALDCLHISWAVWMLHDKLHQMQQQPLGIRLGICLGSDQMHCQHIRMARRCLHSTWAFLV